jgi:hypothetical protein
MLALLVKKEKTPDPISAIEVFTLDFLLGLIFDLHSPGGKLITAA